jgi:hypothetical protein
VFKVRKIDFDGPIGDYILLKTSKGGHSWKKSLISLARLTLGHATILCPKLWQRHAYVCYCPSEGDSIQGHVTVPRQINARAGCCQPRYSFPQILVWGIGGECDGGAAEPRGAELALVSNRWHFRHSPSKRDIIRPSGPAGRPSACVACTLRSLRLRGHARTLGLWIS